MSEMGLETNEHENINKVSNTFRLVLFDQESTLSHPNFTNTNSSITGRNILSEQKQSVRLRRESSQNSISEYNKV